MYVKTALTCIYLLTQLPRNQEPQLLLDSEWHPLGTLYNSLGNKINLSNEPEHDKTNCETSEDSDQPGKLPSLISLRCAAAQSDQSLTCSCLVWSVFVVQLPSLITLLCALWVWEAKDPKFLQADSKDSDQTGWMFGYSASSLGTPVILFVLSYSCSNIISNWNINPLMLWLTV